jgi:hypothetical protein
MKTLIIAFALSWIPTASFAAKKACTYQVDESSIAVFWTAYKTTEKTPVQGALKDVRFKVPPRPLKNMKALLSTTKASGLIGDEKKSDTGNPARDLTLYQKFFSLIQANGKYSGAFNHVKGDDQKGTMDLQLMFNQLKKTVPMNYVVSDQGAFEATGEFNMNEFALGAAIASLNQACMELHKGKDGISKTWPNVGLKVTAKIKKDCGKK